MTTYTGTSPSDRLALYPHGVFRVVVERSGLSALSYATGVLRWRQVVEGVIERSASPAGFPLGGGLDNVTNADRTAVLDYRVGSHPGALPVSALVQAVEDATPYASVVSITHVGTVPRERDGGAAESARQRDVAQVGARETAAADTLTARLAGGVTGALKGARTVFVAAAVIAGVVLVFVYLPKPRT